MKNWSVIYVHSVQDSSVVKSIFICFKGNPELFCVTFESFGKSCGVLNCLPRFLRFMNLHDPAEHDVSI